MRTVSATTEHKAKDNQSQAKLSQPIHDSYKQPLKDRTQAGGHLFDLYRRAKVFYSLRQRSLYKVRLAAG